MTSDKPVAFHSGAPREVVTSPLALVTASYFLPPGRHKASIEDTQRLFVTEAPFQQERTAIFTALVEWMGQVAAVLGPCSFWIDGGFVTHKPWGPPNDVDVTIASTSARFDGLTEQQRDLLLPLLTRHDGQIRVQPMNGLVDAFIVLIDNPASYEYWDGFWSGLRGRDGQIAPQVAKGYLEVSS